MVTTATILAPGSFVFFIFSVSVYFQGDFCPATILAPGRQAGLRRKIIVESITMVTWHL